MKRHAPTPDENVGADEFAQSTAQLALVLDLANQAFARHRPAGLTVDRLAGRLHKLRRQVAPASGKNSSFGPAHPWRNIWSKIRLRAGRSKSHADIRAMQACWTFTTSTPLRMKIVASSTSLGRQIYAYTSEAASSVAGRERRDILTRAVDETARRVGKGGGAGNCVRSSARS